MKIHRNCVHKNCCGNCKKGYRHRKLIWSWYEGREIAHYICLNCDHITYLERVDGEVIVLETLKNSHILSDEYNGLYAGEVHDGIVRNNGRRKYENMVK